MPGNFFFMLGNACIVVVLTFNAPITGLMLRFILDFNSENLFQASYHPFITGEAFTGPYEPVQETPRIVSTIIN